MTIQHKLVAIKAGVTAIVAERDYYREKCQRTDSILEEIKKMLLDSNQTSDEILALCNRGIDNLSLILPDAVVLDMPLADILNKKESNE